MMFILVLYLGIELDTTERVATRLNEPRTIAVNICRGCYIVLWLSALIYNFNTIQMDRLIQFKGKRVSDGKWVVGFFFGTFPTRPEATYLGFTWETRHEVHRKSVGQFTGLELGNGIYLFEGDTVAYEKHHGYLMSSFEAVIVFKNSGFGLLRTKGDCSGIYTAFSEFDEPDHDVLPYLKVIGNQFDNIDQH